MTQILPLFPDMPQQRPIVIAGPCSAETEEQTVGTARALAANGIKIFRAGIWKPRTHPNGFEGVGVVGLDWLARVRRETGMLTATEVANRIHVEQALESGIDMVWIGARTSANPFAMQEIADALKNMGRDIPVLVKNPVNPDLELWIGAMQRISNAGFHRIGAIHRGFSQYGESLYRNNPQWRIPLELSRRYPRIPMICDPSHIGGKRELISSISQQALDMKFDGLIIESHCCPDEAWSDKSQQVTPDMLNTILDALVVRDKSVSTECLSTLRRQIDNIDDEILSLLSRRMQVSREIGEYKRDHSMPVIQTDRYNDLMQRRVNDAVSLGLSADFMRSILSAIHEESVRQQVELLIQSQDS